MNSQKSTCSLIIVTSMRRLVTPLIGNEDRAPVDSLEELGRDSLHHWRPRDVHPEDSPFSGTFGVDHLICPPVIFPVCRMNTFFESWNCSAKK